MNQNELKPISREDKEAVDILVREIVKAINEKAVNCDRTYKTVVGKITAKGYVVSDETGCERTVKCAVPGIALRPGQMVWVTLPQGKLNEMFISGLAGK